MTSRDFNELLACPRCDNRIIFDKGQFQCRGCKTEFPVLDGVPFLVSDPGTTLYEWRERYHALIRRLEQDIERIELSLKQGDLPELTCKRLESSKKANAAYIDELTAVLNPLDVTSLPANLETYLALRTRLPSDQGITTYMLICIATGAGVIRKIPIPYV